MTPSAQNREKKIIPLQFSAKPLKRQAVRLNPESPSHQTRQIQPSTKHQKRAYPSPPNPWEERAVSPAAPPTPHSRESQGQGFLGDSLQIGALGEIRAIDSIRVSRRAILAAPSARMKSRNTRPREFVN